MRSAGVGYVVLVCVLIACSGCQTIPGADVKKTGTSEQLEKDLRAFQDCYLCPEHDWDYMFEPGKFPTLVWNDPSTVEKAVGTCELTVRWFNNQLEEVSQPTEPGRYMAYVEGMSEKGFKIRRSLTFFCRPADWKPWRAHPLATVGYPEGIPIDKSVWEEHEELIGEAAASQFVKYLQTDQSGAILMSYLHETKSRGRKPTHMESPKMANDDIHLALKLKILSAKGMAKSPGLKPPTKLKKPATALRKGSSAEAGMRPDAANKIREVCKAWVAETGKPFVTLVARNGVIFLHEAFDVEGGDMTPDSQLYMASLTKTMTGLLFAQFMDQGLMDIDDPVGKYLPDYPIAGEDCVTYRHCFTHTAGVKGHYMWGGIHNPWYDNVMSASLAYVTPGVRKRYDGMAYDLVGKAMEVAGRKSIIRLFQEDFFQPLGISHTRIDNMACATTSTAMDMAIMGQLLLNRGSYGDLRLFGPETFEKMLPQKLSKYYPGIDLEIGTGLVWLRSDNLESETDTNYVPEGRMLLSRNTIGHRAASGAVLRVDMDNGIVLVQMRETGKDEGEHFVKLLQAIDDGIIDRKP